MGRYAAVAQRPPSQRTSHHYQGRRERRLIEAHRGARGRHRQHDAQPYGDQQRNRNPDDRNPREDTCLPQREERAENQDKVPNEVQT
jgi:hypothetical protein